MRDHPCFSCTLPDCDETSHQCRARRLVGLAASKERKGTPKSPEERAAKTVVHDIWCLNRAAEASEGGRPFSRKRVTHEANL